MTDRDELLPMPDTAHPSFARQARFVRELMERDRQEVLLHQPVGGVRTWTAEKLDDVTSAAFPPPPVALTIRKYWALAPYVGDPFVYMWRAAVEPESNRWVAGQARPEFVPHAVVCMEEMRTQARRDVSARMEDT